MKVTYFVSIVLLVFLFSCQKNSEPLVPWGKASNGLQLSLKISKSQLKKEEPVIVNLFVKNVSDERMEHTLLATLRLDAMQQGPSYESYFDLMADNQEALYKSSMNHPSSNFVIAPGEQKKYQFDMTRLGWVMAVDSRPPYAEFYDLVQKNEYTLSFELELASDQTVRSNSVKVKIE